MPRRKQSTVPDELLDQLLGGSDPRAALAEGGLLDDLKKALAESAVLTGTGKLELQIPCDRLASFDPQLVAKYQRRFPGFDEKIISMYARGMSTRQIQGHLRELYGSRSPPTWSAAFEAYHALRQNAGKDVCPQEGFAGIGLLRRRPATPDARDHGRSLIPSPGG